MWTVRRSAVHAATGTGSSTAAALRHATAAAAAAVRGHCVRAAPSGGRRVALPLATLHAKAHTWPHSLAAAAAARPSGGRCLSTSAGSDGAADDDGGAAGDGTDAAAAAGVSGSNGAADVGDASASTTSAMAPTPTAAASDRWATLPPHHRSLDQYDSALRTLRRLQGEALQAGMRFAAATATTAAPAPTPAADAAENESAAEAGAAATAATGTPADAAAVTAAAAAPAPPREFSSEELSHATLEFQKGNRAPLAALMARKAPLTTAQIAAKAKSAAPPSYRLGSVPVLPWVRPILPGTKTTLRIPLKELGPFLEHVTAQAKSASRPELPKYVALFNRLARDGQGQLTERPPPIEGALREAAMADAFASLAQIEEADRKAGRRIDGTPIDGPTASDAPTWSQFSARVAARDAAEQAKDKERDKAASEQPTKEAGFSVAIEDGDAAVKQQPSVDAEKVQSAQPSPSPSPSQAANIQAAPIAPARARSFPKPSHPLKFRRVAPPSSAQSLAAQQSSQQQHPPSALATSAAAAGAFSLRQLLYEVHPMGTLVELVSFPASEWKRRELAPLSLAALEAALAEESDGGFLSVRVVALHRAGLLAAGRHPAGFLQADVQVYTDSDDADEAAAADGDGAAAARGAGDGDARLRQLSLDAACTALHEQVRLLLLRHQRAREAAHVPRRAQALWAYDAGRAASVADHAASLTLASAADVQALLAERSVLARVRMAAALVAHDYNVLLRQSALGAEQAADPRWRDIKRTVLEQEKMTVQAALAKLREAPAPLPPGVANGSANAVPAAAAASKSKGDAPADASATDPASSSKSADGEEQSPRTPHAKPAPQPSGPAKSSIQLFSEKVRHRLLTRKMPAEVLAVFDEELGRLEAMETDSNASAHALKHYLDWLSILPWGVCSDEKLDLARAEAVLDREHFGLHDVKNQVLELVAMGLLRNKKRADAEAVATASAATSTEGSSASASESGSAGLEQTHGGKILCLVGPPGVGKTSIGRSIANALDRKFFRFSVGGLGDVSEIKGHRRTYTGALPGQLVRALKNTAVSNPVILVDEIDKLGYRGGGGRAGGGHGGDPSAALLEVLDPEQNGAFMDHYLDVPLDLSRVLFVCTANDAERIPGPLRDRMELVHISGYTALEKHQIARRYLLPALHRATGVRPDQLAVDESAVEALIRWYCREPGVRSLNKHLDKVFRKAALQIARKQGKRDGDAATVAPAAAVDASAVSESAAPVSSSSAPLILVSESNLDSFVGQRKFASDRLYPSATPVGVAMGLAYSEMGGATIFVECGVAEAKEENPAAMAAMDGAEGSALPEQSHSMPPQPRRLDEELAEDEEEEEAEQDDTAASPAGGPPAPRGGGGGGRGGFFCTGQLGSVMKESGSIAYTVAKRLLASAADQPSALRWFQSSLLHLHLPTGAQPKDGPSAGVALTMALLSLALHRPIRPDLAMSGELTLTGQVTAVGGVREKLLAAKRAKVTAVVLPEQNRAQVHEVQISSPELVDGMQIHFVGHVRDVLPIAFPGIQMTTEAHQRPQAQQEHRQHQHVTSSLLTDLAVASPSADARL